MFAVELDYFWFDENAFNMSNEEVSGFCWKKVVEFARKDDLDLPSRVAGIYCTHNRLLLPYISGALARISCYTNLKKEVDFYEWFINKRGGICCVCIIFV